MGKIIKYFKDRESWSVPALLTLIVYVPLLVWLKMDNSLPHWDMGRHLYNSVEYGRLWADFIAGRGSFVQLLSAYFYYPPFFYQAGVLFYIFFGVTQKVAVASNLIWIFIMIYSLYHLAQMMWNKKSAVLALAVLFSMPMIIGAMREYQIDLALSAWVMLACFLIAKYQKKPELRGAIWIGIAVGLGMLLKWTFLAYVLPFMAWVLYTALREGKTRSKRMIWHLGAAVVVTLLCAGIWYVANRHNIRADFVANGIDAARREGDPTGFSLAAFGYYAKALSDWYLLLPLSVLFVITAIAGCLRGKRSTGNLLILATIVFIYVVFSLMPNKDARYIMPVAPFIALVIASGINLIGSKRWQLAAVLFLMLLLGANNLTVAFAGSNGRDVAFSPNAVLLRGSSYTNGAPKSQFCPIEAITHSIPQGASARLVGNNPIEFNNWALSFYLEKNGRIWSGEGADALNSDYWIVRLDGSEQSKAVLFQYQDMARIVGNYSCSDRSLIIVMKNANRAETYLPRY